MRAQCITARRDCPNMEVMHFPHTVYFDHGVGDLFRIEMCRDAFHENVPRSIWPEPYNGFKSVSRVDSRQMIHFPIYLNDIAKLWRLAMLLSTLTAQRTNT